MNVELWGYDSTNHKWVKFAVSASGELVIADGATETTLLLIEGAVDGIEALLAGGLPAALDGLSLKVKEQSPITGFATSANQTSIITLLTFGGNVYSKTMTMADDNATRFEATAKKLRDVVIIVKTHNMLLGETGVEVYPVGAGETIGFTLVDISTLYFKNAGAGNNGVITILGVEV